MKREIGIVCAKRTQAEGLAKTIEAMYGLQLKFGTRADVLNGGFRHVEILLSTWDMVCMEKNEIEIFLPGLRQLNYCAGNSSYFERPFQQCGVLVKNSISINSKAVADFAFGLILLSNKGFFPLSRWYRRGGIFFWRAIRQRMNTWPANGNATVGILGFGNVGRALSVNLSTMGWHQLVYDRVQVDFAGVSQITSLEQIFKRSDVIVNCLPDTEETQNMLRIEHFRAMKSTATFINVGRGRQVNHRHLLRSLILKGSRTAILDVLSKEPLRPWSIVRLLPNIYISPHIAGCTGQEIRSMIKHQCDEIFY